MTASTDENANTTGVAYDPDGRLDEIVYPSGGQVDAFGMTTPGGWSS